MLLSVCLSLSLSFSFCVFVFMFNNRRGQPQGGLCEMRRRLRSRDRGGNGDLSDSDDAYEAGYFVETGLGDVVSGLRTFVRGRGSRRY